MRRIPTAVPGIPSPQQPRRLRGRPPSGIRHVTVPETPPCPSTGSIAWRCSWPAHSAPVASPRPPPRPIPATRSFGPLALVALTQAPALLAFGLVPVRGICLRAGACAIGLGAALFCADLAVRHFLGPHLFPYAAPIGGTAMIAGWIAVAIGGLLVRARPGH